MNMTSRTDILENEDATTRIGANFARGLERGTYIALDGALGAGKTCIARGLLNQLGHLGKVKSPTYPILETYQFDTFEVCHFDFYRISSPSEIIDAGFDEMFNALNVCIVEWSKNAGDFLRKPDIEVKLTPWDNQRKVEIIALTTLGQKNLEHFE